MGRLILQVIVISLSGLEKRRDSMNCKKQDVSVDVDFKNKVCFLCGTP